MFSTFLAGLGGYFDKRWLLSAFFPSLGFWAALLAVFAGVRGLTDSLLWWQGQPAKLQTIAIAAGLSGVAFFAYGLSNFQTALTRFFEGNWQLQPLAWVASKRRDLYERKFQYLTRQTFQLAQQNAQLAEALRNPADPRHQEALRVSQDSATYERELFLYYPEQKGQVMATRFGNIIRSAEYYPFGRYQIDAVVIWPRLYPYLPEAFVDNFLSARTSMTFMLVITALSFVFSLITCIPLALFTNHWLLFLACALAFPLAWVSYRTSLQGATLYGELCKTAFDLHRWKLLEALHIKYPETYEDEWTIWGELNYFIYRGETPFVTYDVKKPPKENKDQMNVRVTFGPDETAPPPVDNTAEESQKPPLKPSADTKPTPSSTPETTVPVPAVNASAAGARPRDILSVCYFGGVIILCIVIAPLMSSRSIPTIDIPILANDIPSYHLIKPEDLAHKKIAKADVKEEIVTDDKLLIGFFSLQPLSRDAAVSRSQIQELKDTTTLANSVIVAIPATPSMLLGGTLKPGNLVDISLVNERANPPVESSFENILVLDVKTLPEKPTAADKPAEPQFVVVIALPKAAVKKFRDNIGRGPILISRNSI